MRDELNIFKTTHSRIFFAKVLVVLNKQNGFNVWKAAMRGYFYTFAPAKEYNDGK